MTVSSNPFPIRYAGDGTSKTFAVATYFLEEQDGTAHLAVTKRDLAGTETTLTQGTDYTVTGANNPAGGSITITGTAPLATDTIVVTRSVPDTQETDYIAYDDFPAESHERALDKLTMRMQERSNDLNRALLLGATDVDGSGAYDAGGNRIKGLGTPTAATDAATKAYVDANSGGGGGGGITSHGALTGLSGDDHTQYYNQARGDARYAQLSHNHAATDVTSGTFASARISEESVTQHAAAMAVTASQVTDFGEAVDDQVNTLLTAGSGISLTYDDAGDSLTIAATGGGGGGGTWDKPSLKADYSATGDGVADDTTAFNSAIAANKPFYVPSGTYKTTLAAAAMVGRFSGDGQVIDSASKKRGHYFSHINAAPSTLGSRDSIGDAFNGDTSSIQFAVEHRITGAATMGQPASGYSYRHECYPHFTYLRNDSGHNESLAGNGGRTGTCAYQTKVDQYGQGDAVAYNALVFVSGTKAGSTSYLANPAGVILNGSIIGGADGVYLNTVEFDMQDNGFDVCGIGTVTNMTRTVATGAKGAVWKGHLVQSIGSQNIDTAYSVAGKTKIGLDLTQCTLEATGRAITMKSGQKIFFNATSSGVTYANLSGSESIHWSGSALVTAVGGQPVIQAQSSNVILAPSGVGKLKANSSEVQVAGSLNLRSSLDGTKYFEATSSSVSARSDFMVSSSIGGTNYFRARSTEVNCSVQLKVNGILDIYNPTLSGSKTTTGTWLRIRVGGADRYLELFN